MFYWSLNSFIIIMVVRNNSINVKFIDDINELDFLDDNKYKVYEEINESIWILDELLTRTSNFSRLIDQDQRIRIDKSIAEILPVLHMFCDDEDLSLKKICLTALKKVKKIFPDLNEKNKYKF